MLSRTTYNDGKHLSTNNLEALESPRILEDLIEREKFSIIENKLDSDNTKNVLEFIEVLQKKLNKFDSIKPNVEDSGKKTQEDGITLQLLNSCSNNFSNSNVLEIKLKSLDKKGCKQIKPKICSRTEKETNLHPSTRVVGKRSVDLPSLEGLRDLESDRKVQESLDTFIRQTMGCEPYMSFPNTSGEKPLQKIIEDQKAMNKCVKNLKVDIDIHDGIEDNINVELHQVDLERSPSKIKRGVDSGRELQIDWNLQTIKSTVPQIVPSYATKNQGKLNPSMDHHTDLPSWPLLSPSKVQLQKCEKCSREFFSSFNRQRHTRTHRRTSHADKEELLLKRKNVAAFWDKLNQDEAQRIFASSKKYELEDLSGEVVVNHLLALRKQKSPMTLPPAYIKAGQDLLDMLDNKQIVFPLFSEQILSILDEANEKTFLCSQGDVSKIGLEEKNLVASLGFIVEQTLVKAWMADKDAEALRNQQELVKEEEAAQMKREKNVAKKKKKKEKSRQRGLKERKRGTTQLVVNEENESVDGENLSAEIVEEDNSPTASSTSMNSYGFENLLLEHLEMKINSQIQNADDKIQNVGGETGHQKPSKSVALEFANEKQTQHSKCGIISHGEEGEWSSNFPSSNKVEERGQGGYGRVLEQDQNSIESRKYTSLRFYREPINIDNQNSYQRGNWVPDPRFQEGTHQNSHRALQKPLIGTPYTSNIDLSTNPITGFYRGKFASLKGSAPFSTTQQWAKKAQTPAVVDYINKNGHEDESSYKHVTSTNKINVKDSKEVHTILACEIDVDAISRTNKVEKEEFRTFEKKEPSLATIPSVAKVMAGIGALSNIPTTSFNLDVNSEDWPSLSNSHAAYYSKSARMYSLSSNQCEMNSRPSKKLNIDRGDGHQVGLEYKVGGSIVTIIPPVKDTIDETTTSLVTTDLQKGIMIGSVSVPLGDCVHLSKRKLGSVGRKISAPLLVQQSYTTSLAPPLVQYTEDPMTSTSNQQRIHDGINHLEYEDSSNTQVRDPYGDPIHYRTSSIKYVPSMNFNIRHMKGFTYPLGDRGERGILSNQPSWSGGLVRNLLQKVWRPIRSINENVDSHSSSGINIESSPTNAIKKISTDLGGREESLDAASLQLVKGTQLQDINIKEVDECSTFAIDFKAQVGDQNFVEDVNNKKENGAKDTTNCDESLVNMDNENLQNYQETIQNDSMRRVDSDKNFQPLKNNAFELHSNCIFEDKKNNTENMDDVAQIQIASSHSTWIAEAIKFHLSRWESGLKDPETVVGSCEEEHLELQTSTWMDFMNTLPSITSRLSCYRQ